MHLIDLYFLNFVFVRSLQFVFETKYSRTEELDSTEVDRGQSQILQLIDLYFLDFVFVRSVQFVFETKYSRTEALDSVGCRS